MTQRRWVNAKSHQDKKLKDNKKIVEKLSAGFLFNKNRSSLLLKIL